MYLAYVDESGDAGVVNSPTRYFVLSCLLVHETKWGDTLDGLVAMRARMREQHGIPTWPELTSTDTRRTRGALHSWPPKPGGFRLVGPTAQRTNHEALY